MRRIIIATNNLGKVNEIKECLSDLPFDIKSLNDIGRSINVIEDEPDFEGNSYKKAAFVGSALNEIALADDSGLVVDALGGEPGVYSARYAGDNATDLQNNEKLLSALAKVPPGLRSASFCCVVTLYIPGGYFLQTKGTCKGRIGIEPKGTGGFGYDTLFITDAYDRTMAELTPQEKNAISHRGRALKSLKDRLAELNPAIFDIKGSYNG